MARSYRYNLERYLVPAFGNREISSPIRCDVETFLAEKAKTYSRNSLRGMRAALSGILSWAVANEWVPKNACHGVKLPKVGGKTKHTILTTEQVQSLLERVPEPLATLVLFLAVTGVRVGEAVVVRFRRRCAPHPTANL